MGCAEGVIKGKITWLEEQGLRGLHQMVHVLAPTATIAWIVAGMVDATEIVAEAIKIGTDEVYENKKLVQEYLL